MKKCEHCGQSGQIGDLFQWVNPWYGYLMWICNDREACSLRYVEQHDQERAKATA